MPTRPFDMVIDPRRMPGGFAVLNVATWRSFRRLHENLLAELTFAIDWPGRGALVQVLQLLANAASAIIGILVPAVSHSGDTWGASLAAGISSSVGVAGGAGALIAGKMGMLLDSAQNLNGPVQQLESAVSNAEQLITQFTQSSGNTTPATGSTSA